MTVQQVVRDILERAVEDGLVSPATEDMRDEWDRQTFPAADPAGCTGRLRCGAGFPRGKGRVQGLFHALDATLSGRSGC